MYLHGEKGFIGDKEVALVRVKYDSNSFVYYYFFNHFP